MDKRKHPRFDVASGASVNVLGQSNVHRGQILDLSQAGLKLVMPVAFELGEIIRAEIGDEVFVAVVCHCRKSREGTWQVGAEMMHSIKRTHLDALVQEWGVSQPA